MGKAVSTTFVTSRIPVGSYAGNGTSHIITVGFRPRVVRISTEDGKTLISKQDGKSSVGHGQVASGGGISMRSFRIADGEGITITDTGFSINDNPAINSDGIEYLWEVR